jgi:hypothetical protein
MLYSLQGTHGVLPPTILFVPQHVSLSYSYSYNYSPSGGTDEEQISHLFIMNWALTTLQHAIDFAVWVMPDTIQPIPKVPLIVDLTQQEWSLRRSILARSHVMTCI